MVYINPTLSIIILNVCGLNTLIKRQELSEWVKKQGPTTCSLQETYFRYEDTKTLKVKVYRNIYYASINQKKAGVSPNFRQSNENYK